MPFRILKMIPTSGFLTALECTRFDFGRGSDPDPAGGAYSAPLAGLQGPASKGRGGEGEEEVGEGQGMGEWNGRGKDARERRGKGGEEKKKERSGREEK